MSVSAIDRAISAVPAAPATQPVSARAEQRVPDAMLKGIAVPGPVQSGDNAAASVEKAAARMEAYARSIGRSLQFRVDENSGRVVVSVRDPSTGELIRQIPSEDALRIAEDPGTADSSGGRLLIEGLA